MPTLSFPRDAYGSFRQRLLNDPYASGLTFGAATTNNVGIAEATNINNQDPFSIVMWVYPTTLTASRRFWHKGPSAAKRLAIDAVTSNLEVEIGRATTTTLYTANDGLGLTVNQWCFVGITFNSTAASGQIVNIYRARPWYSPVEVTYGVTTDGAGALTDDATGSASNRRMVWGNRTAEDVSFQGIIGFGAYWGGVELSVAQMAQQWEDPCVTPGCRVWMPLGLYGAGPQRDYSGNNNHGTVSGATYTPFGVPRSRWPAWHRRNMGIGVAPSGRIFKLAGDGGGLAGPMRGLVA